MSLTLNLQEHLSNEELERRYREAKNPVLRSHYQIVWLLGRGKTTREVVEATGYSPNWVRELAGRYNRRGVQGLGDRQYGNPGGAGKVLLDPVQRKELGKALEGRPEDGGL